MREVIVAQDAEGWEAMDKEMATLNYHDIYKPVLRVKGLRTFELGWVVHRKIKNTVFDRKKAKWSPKVTTNAMGLTTMKQFPRGWS